MNQKRVTLLAIDTFVRVTIVASMLALLFGCNRGGDNSLDNDAKSLQRLPVAQLQLKQAANCDELKDYITQSLIKQYTSIPRDINYYYACPAPGGSADGTAPPDMAVPAPGGDRNFTGGDSSSGESSADAAPVPGDVSDTNNQEQGVHEGDIVKADALGNIYVLSGRHFIIADGFPPQDISELARIDLGGHGLNLFLDKENQRVIIMARYDQPYYITDDVPTAEEEASSVIYPKPQQDYTVVLFYDVSTPSNPQLVDQLRLRGYFREGRRINDRLHLVSNYYLRPTGLFEDPEFWQLRNEFNSAVYSARCDNPDADVADNPAVIAAQNKLAAKITNVVTALDPSTYTPDAYRVNSNGGSESIPYLACGNIHFPGVKNTLGLQLITSVDTDGGNLQAAGVVNNSYITYVSENNLYLAENSFNWWWLTDDGSWPSSQTAIYKFAISGDAPRYVATGRVDGYVNNQFSLSEYNNVLRVATTQRDRVPTDDGRGQWHRENHVSVLSDNGSGGLNIIGEVRGFAPDESIRSARFLGDRGFVVTFRNIDPLFTFDLSNPENPVLMGELTIPGFSTYMHPYDENHLITIGRAGGDGGTGVGNGMQLQLVDVSDMASPDVVASHIPEMPDGWSWSAAEYDHKAFTFYKPANLLAIPWQGWSGTGVQPFSGIVAFDVSLNDGFVERGRVDHADLAYDYYCLDNPALLNMYVTNCNDGLYTQWAAPRRSIVMTDVNENVSDIYLFTLSDVGLKASSIYNLPDTLGSMVFPQQPYPWWHFRNYPVPINDPVPVASVQPVM
ncbi:MAG: beta-propeller domain-containing protein [Gammaproteobacteria bacterium]